MERKKFLPLEFDIVFFEVDDIVRTSAFPGGGMGGGGFGGGGFGGGDSSSSSDDDGDIELPWN